jgi:hypothetical protein
MDAKREPETSTSIDFNADHREKHGLLPCPNTSPKTAFEQASTAERQLRNIVLHTPLVLRNMLPRTFHVQELPQSPGEFLQVNVQDLNLTLQLLDTFRHQQILNGSVTTKMLKLTLASSWAMVDLPLRRTNAEISGK